MAEAIEATDADASVIYVPPDSQEPQSSKPRMRLHHSQWCHRRITEGIPTLAW